MTKKIEYLAGKREILADCKALWTYRSLFFDEGFGTDNPVLRVYERVINSWKQGSIHSKEYIDFDYYVRLRFDGMNHSEASKYAKAR